MIKLQKQCHVKTVYDDKRKQYNLNMVTDDGKYYLNFWLSKDEVLTIANSMIDLVKRVEADKDDKYDD